jgi:hypothetical protein
MAQTQFASDPAWGMALVYTNARDLLQPEDGEEPQNEQGEQGGGPGVAGKKKKRQPEHETDEHHPSPEQNRAQIAIVQSDDANASEMVEETIAGMSIISENVPDKISVLNVTELVSDALPTAEVDISLQQAMPVIIAADNAAPVAISSEIPAIAEFAAVVSGPVHENQTAAAMTFLPATFLQLGDELQNLFESPAQVPVDIVLAVETEIPPVTGPDPTLPVFVPEFSSELPAMVSVEAPDLSPDSIPSIQSELSEVENSSIAQLEPNSDTSPTITEVALQTILPAVPTQETRTELPHLFLPEMEMPPQPAAIHTTEKPVPQNTISEPVAAIPVTTKDTHVPKNEIIPGAIESPSLPASTIIVPLTTPQQPNKPANPSTVNIPVRKEEMAVPPTIRPNEAKTEKPATPVRKESETKESFKSQPDYIIPNFSPEPKTITPEVIPQEKPHESISEKPAVEKNTPTERHSEKSVAETAAKPEIVPEITPETAKEITKEFKENHGDACTCPFCMAEAQAKAEQEVKAEKPPETTPMQAFSQNHGDACTCPFCQAEAAAKTEQNITHDFSDNNSDAAKIAVTQQKITPASIETMDLF